MSCVAFFQRIPGPAHLPPPFGQHFIANTVYSRGPAEPKSGTPSPSKSPTVGGPPQPPCTASGPKMNFLLVQSHTDTVSAPLCDCTNRMSGFLSPLKSAIAG